MSIEYYVLCREPLPDHPEDWSVDVGPIAVSKMELEPELIALVRGVPPVAALNFSARASAAELLWPVVSELARTTRGVVVYEDGPEVCEDHEDDPPLRRSHEEILAAWQRIIDEAVDGETAAQATAQAAWERKHALDPRAAEEDDWSDV